MKRTERYPLQCPETSNTSSEVRGLMKIEEFVNTVFS
jgi:hypothetical protein